MLKRLFHEGRKRIVVDITDSDLLGDAGLTPLMNALRRVRVDDDAALVVVNGDPVNARLFELAGVDQLFSLFASREEATAALADPAMGRFRAAGASNTT